MKYSLKTLLKLRDYVQIIMLWVGAFIFYIFMTYSMIDDSYFLDHGFNVKDFLISELTGALYVGVFMGTNLFLLQQYVYPRFFYRYGILLTSILRSFLFIVVSFAALLIVIELNKIHYITINNLFALQVNAKWLVCFTFYCLLVHIFITLLQAFRRRLGNSYFKSLLYGHYRIPVVEYRVFMFLDMYASVTAAEEAGHYNYSLLLQECFTDLSEILHEHEAEVYQYVGDEAVITWKVTHGFKRRQCIKLYEAFAGRLLDKKDFYQDRFGLVPRFKASINEGLVTVAEIGQIKTEIAYHGDVLSTAARVRDLCNLYQADLLITQSFFEQLSSFEKEQFTSIEPTVLRGKKKAVAIYKTCS
ncbi:adenylate cyclase [Flavobacterium sp. 90]|uniref:adenylate/guanylate cyclase domain-containing protein n=1 Tax=unclassified Flavobacterium TaxID=196869 RepID=UPI000EB36010|nr:MULTISPECIES: adenylate/guanylate cyclase domain-containing protein [unclassified Flavobacterium]RKR08932.1 adenylate cyclase [Flavobacterium sp. 81]TCK52720.1 adenylate cyclase [Flavobacterium sp. 90]